MNYLEIAKAEYKEFLKIYNQLSEENYINPYVCTLCQISEKILKHFIEIEDLGLTQENLNTILKTHNQKILYNYFKDSLLEFDIQKSDIAEISSYYYDTRYPGGSFYIATYDDLKQAVSTINKLLEWAGKMLNKDSFKKTNNFI